MIKVNEEVLKETTKRSIKSPKKRAVFRLHKTDSDILQRFVNVAQPDSYVEPHKHEHSIELFIALRGKMEVMEHNDEGKVIDKYVISPTGENICVEIEKGKRHSMNALEKLCCIYCYERAI